MAITIENLEYVKNSKLEKKQDVINKEKYIEFLIQKGLEECFTFSTTYSKLIDLVENNALGDAQSNRDELNMLKSNLFYYENVMPALVTGDYENIEKYGSLSAEELKETSRSLRRQMIALLDEKYGHLY